MSDDADTLDSMLRGVAAAPSVRPPPRIGDKLGGRYLIEGAVGIGGMGMVFRAVDEKLGETVALKVMTGALDESVLRDEVRLAQKVTHPNVCRTFDLEDVDGYHLVKMELVPGETLAARLTREPKLPIGECIRIARAIASGLAAAHDRKIVHADLKPANVMLDGERVVLMDFGIARLAADAATGVRGTVGYMAPELVREGKADERGDIYALGCVLYEMLAGDQVFTGSTLVLATRHASEPAPDVRGKRPETPRWLARAVARMLAKQPADRTPGLALLVSGPRSRLRWIAPVAAVAIAASFAGYRLTRRSPWIPHIQDYPQFEENGDDMALSPDGAWIAFASDRTEHEHWRPYVMSTRTGEAVRLGDMGASQLRWMHDGKAILFSNDTRSFRLPVAGAPPRAQGPVEDIGSGMVVDDCGDALLFVERDMKRPRVVLRFHDGRDEQVFAGDIRDFINDAACDPSGQHIVVVSGPSYMGGHNDVYLADRLRNVRRLTTDHRSGNAARFTPSGHSIVVSRLVDQDKLQLFEMSLDGNDVRRLVVDDGPDSPDSVSCDGRTLVFMRDETTFLPVILSTTGKREVTRRHGLFLLAREVSPQLIVANLSGPAGPQVVTVGIDSGAVHVLAPGDRAFPSLDGKTIYFGPPDALATLSAIPVGGGAPAVVAKLPGELQFGNAGVDGLHVSVSINGTEIAGYRIAGGKIEPEGVAGLVTVAPSGGWRAVTAYGDKALGEGAELSLVPPGAALDHPSRHFHVDSIHNGWLDDHRITYCSNDHCEILDVTNPNAPVVKLPLAMAGLTATVMRDGVHVLDSLLQGHVTRHAITNFDER